MPRKKTFEARFTDAVLGRCLSEPEARPNQSTSAARSSTLSLLLPTMANRVCIGDPGTVEKMSTTYLAEQLERVSNSVRAKGRLAACL
ncbi:hypothetical protein M514_11557 [Trichuris suis]|uniref:Uncharacterized protein n=1 Tax=Trichuris suis TaxID=68888 RepID=A0A085NHV0_9BILA|nr:hypothetical protein M513_11557 [Trichuris suis]KFD69046.1 hypothetical protein M514_11557 [Trichuris suis]